MRTKEPDESDEEYLRDVASWKSYWANGGILFWAVVAFIIGSILI